MYFLKKNVDYVKLIISDTTTKYILEITLYNN